MTCKILGLLVTMHLASEICYLMDWSQLQ